MCRYATAYKSHYACFSCRKTFKRKLLRDIKGGDAKDLIETTAKCPECNAPMADMGLDFKAPKKQDIKAWKHIANLYTVGITFHSCGCTGPGYIPNDKEALINHLSKIKKTYQKHQLFWINRKENPKTQSEIARDQHYNRAFFNQVPKKVKIGTKNNPEYNSTEAQIYWSKKIADVEEKIIEIKTK